MRPPNHPPASKQYERQPVSDRSHARAEPHLPIIAAQARVPQSDQPGQRNGWCTRNPCNLVDKPRLERNADIRYLDQEELDALLQAVPSDTPYGPSDRALCLTAAMTGRRQGELLALRWADIDWTASRVRVRRSYVRGEWGPPKSRRSSRSVPMADRVARELELHFQRSHFQKDADLVLCDSLD